MVSVLSRVPSHGSVTVGNSTMTPATIATASQPITLVMCPGLISSQNATAQSGAIARL